MQLCMGRRQPRADGGGVGTSRWVANPARRVGGTRALQEKLVEILKLGNFRGFIVLFLPKRQEQLGYILPPEKKKYSA